jgi:hypothetical protein
VERQERETLPDDSYLVVDAVKMAPRVLCPKNEYGKILTPQYSFYEYSNSSDKFFMKSFYNNKKRVVK